MHEIGARLFDRAVAEKARPLAARRRLKATAGALRDGGIADEAAGDRARPRARGASPPARCPSRRSALAIELLVERERAGVGAWYEFFPRSEGARAPEGRPLEERHLPHRGQAPARRRRDGLRRRLPAADPPDRRDASARARTTRSTPGPTTPAPRGRSASPTGGHDAVHPDLGTLADFRAFVRAAARARPRGRARPRAAGLARPPVGRRAPGLVHDAARRHRSPTPRTRRRSTRTSTRSTSTTTPTGIVAEVLRIVRHWIGQGVRIFRVDNPHTKPLRRSGSG